MVGNSPLGGDNRVTDLHHSKPSAQREKQRWLSESCHDALLALIPMGRIKNYYGKTVVCIYIVRGVFWD